MKGKIIIERQLMKISSEVFVVVIDQIVDLWVMTHTIVGEYQGFGGICFPQSIGIYLQDYMMSQPRRHFDPEEGGRMFL
jgi:hypothetical protein